MITDKEVRVVLDTIVDPCSAAAGDPAGLATMGLVRHLEVTQTPDGAAISVTIGVTEPSCLMGGPFALEAQRRLEALSGVHEVRVDLDTRHDWSPHDMAPAYRVRRAAAYRPGAALLQGRVS